MAHPIPSQDLPAFQRLREIMHILRAPGGCPWDAEQTHESLIPHLIEEAYETAAAIRSGERDAIVDELGDVLLQPVFHAEIASETGGFDFDDIAHAICEKLIRRHPHVFGDTTISQDPDAVISQWEKIKAGEEKTRSYPIESETQQGTILGKIPRGLPALMAAQKIQKKAAKVGFDWPELQPVIEKVREELDEVVAAGQERDAEHLAEEIGDLLFAVVNLARKTGHEAEELLDAANRKFVDRFRSMEKTLDESGIEIEDADLATMDEAWEKAKGSL